MKKLTKSVLAVVLTASFTVSYAQKSKMKVDTAGTKEIGEVIVTGALGIKKKVDAQTSAQQVVSSEQITQAANPNALSSLTGKVSGVQITQTNVGVNDTYSILIRGTRSITGSNEALVVIDNVVSSARVLQQLPPEVIESVNIIKGGAGAALYGSQGVNGVVVVTTKRGAKSKRMSVSYTGAVDFETVAFMPDRQTEYGQGWSGNKVNVENGAWGPSFSDPAYANKMLPYGIPLYDFNGNGHIDYNPNDFTPAGDEDASIFSPFASFGKKQVKDFFKTGSIFQNTVTVNAGDGDGYVLLSLGNVDRGFMVQDDELKRTTALFKAGMKVNKWRFETILNYSRQQTSTTDQDIYRQLLQSSTDIPITAWKNYPETAYAWNVYYNNPYWYIKHDRHNRLSNYFNVIASAEFELNKHINFAYRANVQYTGQENDNHGDGWQPVILDATAVTSYYNKYKQNNFTYYGDFLANFDYDLFTDLNSKLTLGHNYQETRLDNAQAGGTGIIIPGIYQVWNLTNPSLPYSLDNNKYYKNMHSFFGSLDLAYKNYLYLNATARYEKSSVLPVNNRDYFYPSVGLSFIPTKAFESLTNNGVLNYLKVAASISKTGNSSAIGYYDAYSRASLGSGFPYSVSGPTGGSLSFVIDTAPTSNAIKPEFTTKKEINLLFGLFKDRITFDGAIYREDTDDLITRVTTSNATGLSTSLMNIGKLKGTGIEANLNFTPIKNQDLRWDVGVSYTQNKTIVTKLTDDSKSVRLAGNSFLGVYADEGQELSVIKGIAYERDQEGHIIVDATTGLPNITSTQEVMGRTTPKYILGFTTNLSYKGFKLGVVMDYRTGHKFYSGALQGFTFNGLNVASAGFDRSQPYIVPNSVYWDGAKYVQNTSIAIYQSNLTAGTTDPQTALQNYFGGSRYNTVADNFVLDATAFKVREISLSYTFPDSLTGSKIKNLTIGVHARNPFYKFADENKGYGDPETAFDPRYRGISNAGQYPNLKTFGGSVSLTF